MAGIVLYLSFAVILLGCISTAMVAAEVELCGDHRFFINKFLKSRYERNFVPDIYS